MATASPNKIAAEVVTSPWHGFKAGLGSWWYSNPAGYFVNPVGKHCGA